MGIINPDQHDVFISYASLDNALYRGWIKQFQTDLKERTHIELSDEGHKYDLDQLDFFFDQETMPANGEIAGELIDAIKISNFLIMFVGDHYLTSAYCARELEWFSSRFQTLERHALENMFMVVLTSAAVRQASEGTLGKIKAQAKYVPAFGKAENDGPHPKHLLVGVGDYMADNPEYIKLVDGVASTLAKRMIKKIPAEGSHAAVSRDSGATGGPGTKGKPTIAFGAVVRNMKDYRCKLAAKIAEAHSVRVDTLELDDFSGLTADEFKERLKEATMFVQLIDKSPCGFLGGQPGGFLAAQEKLVPPTLPILWITPKERSDVSPVEQDPQHLDYLNKVIASARHIAEDEIVQAIGSEVQRRSGGAAPRAKFARIMIEHSDQDQDEVANVRGIVDKAWASDFARRAGIAFPCGRMGPNEECARAA